MNKRKIISLVLFGILVFFLSLLPLSYVFGSSGCSGSNPVNCAFTDAFDFVDYALHITVGQVILLIDSFAFTDLPPKIFIGIRVPIFTDSFNFLDASLKVAITNPIVNNVFTQTTQNAQNVLTLTDNLQDTIITTIAVPIITILVVVGASTKLGVREFPMIIGVGMFTYCALIWIKILPSWAIIFPILAAAASLSLIVSEWLGTRGNAGEA